MDGASCENCGKAEWRDKVSVNLADGAWLCDACSARTAWAEVRRLHESIETAITAVNDQARIAVLRRALPVGNDAA